MSENDCADTGEPCPVSSIARQLAAARKREERLVKLLRDACAYLRCEESNLAAGMVAKIDAELGRET